MYGKEPLLYSKGILLDNILVLNQCVSQIEEVACYSNFYERGLSKSRNRGIECSDADICVITDNDVYFKPDVYNIIEKAFKEYPDADILTFKAETPEGEEFNNYKTNFFWHTRLSLAKVSSIEIAFRRKAIINGKIKFDENFGLGSKFCTGEEYIFLTDALGQGLKIGYIPEVIVYHPKESSGDQFNSISLIEAKGAMIYRVFGLLGVFVCILFSFKKFKKSKSGLLNFIRSIFKGFKAIRAYE